MTPRLLCVPLTGMEIYLTSCFFEGLTNRPRRWHTHPCYELVCIETESGMEFTVIPPLCKHLAVDAPPERISSILFSFLPEGRDDICTVLRDVQTETAVADSFDGASRIRSVKSLALDNSYGAEEQMKAELRLLFVGLARALSPKKQIEPRREQTLDDERLARLEEYFNIRLKDPNCSKQQLADELGVCERQLTRILKDAYNSHFSAILLQSRMTLAEAMREQGKKTPDEIAEAVGYISAHTLKRAYLNFYGKNYIDLTKQDMGT